jgi:hypothetical protein
MKSSQISLFLNYRIWAAYFIIFMQTSCMTERLEKNLDDYTIGGYQLSHLLDKVDPNTMNQSIRKFYRQRLSAHEILHLNQASFPGIHNQITRGIYVGSARDLQLRINHYDVVSQPHRGQSFDFSTEPLLTGKRNSLVLGHGTQSPRQFFLEVPMGFNLSPPVGFDYATHILHPDSALIFKWQLSTTGGMGQVLLFVELQKRPNFNQAPEKSYAHVLIPDVGETDLSTQLDTTGKAAMKVWFYRFFGGMFDPIRGLFISGQIHEGYQLMFYDDRSIID